jgi:hypothetical protein
MDIITIGGILLSLIGAISSIWFLFEKLFQRKKIRWGTKEKGVKKYLII